MPTMINQPHPLEKYVFWFCMLVLLAFFVSLPFMVRDDARLKEAQWQAEHCNMYKNNVIADVPAKCNFDFTEHEARHRND